MKIQRLKKLVREAIKEEIETELPFERVELHVKTLDWTGSIRVDIIRDAYDVTVTFDHRHSIKLDAMSDIAPFVGMLRGRNFVLVSDADPKSSVRCWKSYAGDQIKLEFRRGGVSMYELRLSNVEAEKLASALERMDD